MIKTSTAKRVLSALSLSLLLVTSATTQTNAQKAKSSNDAYADCSRVDDVTLTGRVSGEISKTTELEGQEIKAEARKRVITLTGHVSSKGKKQTAARIAKGVECVRSVVNKLVVRPPIGPAYTCCCNGECYYSSRPCPTCSFVSKCVGDYKAAVLAAKKLQGKERRKALETARRAFYECVDRTSKSS